MDLKIQEAGSLEESVYMRQGLDLKRLVLVTGKKMWLVLMAILVGGILGAGTYKVVTGIVNGQPCYRASADYYITFNFDEFEHGDDYYNAYTWDGILRDDPIVDYALTVLPEEITKEMVKEAVSGEMLGDYRILTVHVVTQKEETTNLIAKAYQESLVHFGQEIELLDKIEVWSQEEAVFWEQNTKTGNAAFLGSLLGGVLSIFLLLFYYVLEAAVYIPKDAAEAFGLPVFGVVTCNKDLLQERILKENLDYFFQEEEIVRWNGEKIPKGEEWEALRKAKHLVLDVTWGRNNVRKILEVLEVLKLQNCKVEGMILTDAKDSFFKAYYGKKYWGMESDKTKGQEGESGTVMETERLENGK